MAVFQANGASQLTVLTTSSLGYDEKEAQDFLHTKNMEFVSSVTPTIAYIVILMVVGLVGNTVVFLVYYKRFKPSATRTYILVMSVCDLLTNIFVLPADVLELRFHFTFFTGWACKLSRTVRCLLVAFSTFILVAIACDRRQTICSVRLRGNESAKQVRFRLGLCVLFSLVFGVPFAVLQGSRSRPFPGTNVTGALCGVDQAYHKTWFSLVYHVILSVAYVICVVIIVISYGTIALYLRRHRKNTVVARMAQIDNSRSVSRPDQDQNTSGEGHNDLVLPTDGSSQVANNTNQMEMPSTSNPDPVSSEEQNREESGPSTSASKLPAGTTRTLIPTRTTTMLFILTIVFIVNYLPYLVIFILEGANKPVVENFSENLYYIGVRSFLLNSAINPIVYSLCSARLRYECRHLLCCRINNSI